MKIAQRLAQRIGSVLKIAALLKLVLIGQRSLHSEPQLLHVDSGLFGRLADCFQVFPTLANLKLKGEDTVVVRLLRLVGHQSFHSKVASVELTTCPSISEMALPNCHDGHLWASVWRINSRHSLTFIVNVKDRFISSTWLEPIWARPFTDFYPLLLGNSAVSFQPVVIGVAKPPRFN